jgi:hypothetical protein
VFCGDLRRPGWALKVVQIRGDGVHEAVSNVSTGGSATSADMQSHVVNDSVGMSATFVVRRNNSDTKAAVFVALNRTLKARLCVCFTALTRYDRLSFYTTYFMYVYDNSVCTYKRTYACMLSALYHWKLHMKVFQCNY